MAGLTVDVSSTFGWNHELYHVDGNVSINKGRGFFKGVRSYAGLQRLSHRMWLEKPDNKVHMAVLTGCMGKRLHVAWDGHLQAQLERYVDNVRVARRLDETNAMRLEVRAFKGCMAIDEAIRPTSADLNITGRGAVLFRLTWADPICWDDKTEPLVVGFCTGVMALLDSLV